MANTIKLIYQKAMSKHLSMDDKVQRALQKHAESIEAIANHLLSIHRKTGAHKITIGKVKSQEFGHIDRYVSLEGPAPISVEFGHRAENGRWVQGLYIITRAGYTARSF